MLADHAAAATVSVRDIAAARRFYEDVLGLTIANEEEKQAVAYHTGGSILVVYQSQFAGTNRATAATWNVGDEIDTMVQALADKGVHFERYEMPDLRHEGDVHVADNGRRVAWFTDPDGNIHGLTNS